MLSTLLRSPSRQENRHVANSDYYFSMQSPWTYIGHVPFIEVVRRHDVNVTYKPISLSDVFVKTGGPAVRQTAPGTATLPHP
jgi:2-hydroxychromene-2-carboxylate isomerase